MRTANRRSNRSRRLSNYDFLKNNITFLIEKGRLIRNLEENDPLPMYSSLRNDMGWWRIIKECVISQYIGAYLNILNAQRQKKNMKLFFADLLSSNGLCEVKGGHDTFFPGSSLLAALRNEGPNHFDKLYFCDLKKENRDILKTRLENLDNILPNKLNYEIYNADSNLAIDDILIDMRKESGGFHNALILADNQGFDIQFYTLQKIQNTHKYTDFIINLPIIPLERQMGSLKKNPSCINCSPDDISLCDNAWTRFIGMPPCLIKKNQIAENYINNLKKIGKEHIEHVDVKGGRSAGIFHYLMLIAVRDTKSGAAWMTLLNRLRERFTNITGDKIKELFNTFFGNQKTLI